MEFPTRRSRISKWLISVGMWAMTGSCRNADASYVGTFGGDFTVYRAIFVALPDGGEASYVAHKETTPGPDKLEGDIDIAKKPETAASYQVSVRARFMSCAFTAHVEQDRLLVDEKQRCEIEVEGYHGDADIKGTLTPPSDGAMKSALTLTPRAAKPPSGVNVDFVGNRGRTINRP